MYEAALSPEGSQGTQVGWHKEVEAESEVRGAVQKQGLGVIGKKG